MKYILERIFPFNEIKLRYLFFCFLCDIFTTPEKKLKQKAQAPSERHKRKAQA
jgi:hypothetical protein